MNDRPELDLIHLVQRARMAHDDRARPSQIDGAYWLEAKAPPGLRPGPTAANFACWSPTAPTRRTWRACGPHCGR